MLTDTKQLKDISQARSSVMHIFRRPLIALLVLAVACLPAIFISNNVVAANAAAGSVIVGVGQLTARNTNGVERPLRRRSSVYAGDTILVGSNAFVQLRFSDGGLVSLRRNSEFRIDKYQFKGEEDGSENLFFSLLKGGLRTLTGRIGKKNKRKYRMNTTVATIGIRGTHYYLVMHNGHLYGMVVEGGVSADNNGGSGEFGAARYFYVADANTAPVWLLYPPPGIFDGFDPPGAGSGDGSGDSFHFGGANADEVADALMFKFPSVLDIFTAPREPEMGRYQEYEFFSVKEY